LQRLDLKVSDGIRRGLATSAVTKACIPLSDRMHAHKDVSLQYEGPHLPPACNDAHLVTQYIMRTASEYKSILHYLTQLPTPAKTDWSMMTLLMADLFFPSACIRRQPTLAWHIEALHIICVRVQPI
jgi:hypothetical protein